jgi:Uma2 family endonuclease
MVIQFKPLTVEEFDEFIRLPENIDREFEYIGGAIFEVVSNPKSSKLGARMATFLGIYLLNDDIGHLTGADGGYIVSGERYIPDVGYISYAKQPELLSIEGYNPYPPDLAVEVLSPSNDDQTMRVKIGNYLAAGTLVWVLDPDKKLVEVYALGTPVNVLRIGDTLEGGNVLPGFKLAVKDIFAEKSAK